MTRDDVLREGGAWLGRLRNRIQWIFQNGSTIPWASDQALKPGLSPKALTELVAEVVAADRNARDSEALALLRDLVSSLEEEEIFARKVAIDRAKKLLGENE